jgi:tyrosyl-tRNA synthetase
MEAYGLPAQVVLTVPLLAGTDGVEKMSKSKGNHIGIHDPAETMFGKVMSISDETMWDWIPALMGRAIDRSVSPMPEKLRLAQELVTRFHGPASGESAAAWWKAGRPPLETQRMRVVQAELYRIVHAVGAATSASDARRKIAQGAVSLDGQRRTDPLGIVVAGTFELRVGKKWVAVIDVSPPAGG